MHRAPTKLGWVAEALEQHRRRPGPQPRAPSAGSIAHCDPASDLPAIGLALDYTRRAPLEPRRAGRARSTGSSRARSRPALEPDELIVEIRRGPLPARRRRVAYRKLAQPASGYSIVGVAAVVASTGGVDQPRPGRR